MNCDFCGARVKVVGHTTKHYELDWPSEEEIKDVAKHEDSDGYFGFLSGCEWLKAYMSERKDEPHEWTLDKLSDME